MLVQSYVKRFKNKMTKIVKNKIINSIVNDLKNKTNKKIDFWKIVKDTKIIDYRVIAETINKSKYSKLWKV